MKYNVLYFDEVKQDIREAKQWYRKQSAGLQKRFANDVTRCILHLTQNPYVHAVRYKKVRIAHPSVFPYSIHYYIDEEKMQIVITAVVHDSRDASFSQQRL